MSMILTALVFQLEVYYEIDRLLTGVSALQKGTTAWWYPTHGHLLRTSYKLRATKIELSHWSTGHSTQLWLAVEKKTNL